MNLPYTNARDVVHALKVRHFPGFHSLPYNRYEPDKSPHWWLSPTGDNPAFRVGKAMLTTSEGWVEDGKLFCGFNIEKGLETDMASTRSEIMQKDWFWHRFIDIADTPLATAIEEAESAIGENLELVVSGIINQGESWACVTFDHEDGKLNQSKYIKGNGDIARLAECRSLSELAGEFRKLVGNAAAAWMWLDVVIGKTFTLDPNGTDDLDRCAAMLKPFGRWMCRI